MRHSESSTSAASPGSNAHDGAFSIRAFIHTEVFSGLLLLAAAVVALAWANSPWKDAYHDLWASKVAIGPLRMHLEKSLLHWINDALMAVFFLVVGLEIKREVLVGELASPRRAALPAIAATGGAVMPALIYLALNLGHPGVDGWGVPMATDIAFALGVLAMLGSRVPLSIKIFLTAVAIVDDIIAVVVIALFYTPSVEWAWLAAATGLLLVLFACNRAGMRALWVYLGLGVALWLAVYESGIHATIAGVLLAFTIPAQTKFDTAEVVARGTDLLREFGRHGERGGDVLTDGAQQETLAELEAVIDGAGAPLQRLEHMLHPWTSFLIVPLFALANAGVTLPSDLGAVATDRVTLGVLVGLVIGKQAGIMLSTWLASTFNLIDLPPDCTWLQLYGVAWLAGIGFTMSLFVADLAFLSDEGGSMHSAAKLGIVVASAVAGLAGWAVITFAARRSLHPTDR